MLYQFLIRQKYLNSCIRVHDKVILMPWQVLKFLDESPVEYPKRATVDDPIPPMRTFRVLKFQIVDDYKNYVKWQRKQVIKNTTH